MLNLDIKYFDILPSTNTALKELAKNGSLEGTVLVAKVQNAGKGSYGRSFFSPDSGLYFSILLRPQYHEKEILYLTPCMAVAVAEAIEKVLKTEVKIKWVNDVFLNGKKVCGILTEGGIDIYGNNYAIIGVGINLTIPKGGFPISIRDTATALYPSLPPKNAKEDLLSEILNNLTSYYDNLPEKAYFKVYKEKSLLIGKEISFSYDNKTLEGLVTDISDNFELMVKLEDGQILTLNSGDVQLKITCKK